MKPGIKFTFCGYGCRRIKLQDSIDNKSTMHNFMKFEIKLSHQNFKKILLIRNEKCWKKFGHMLPIEKRGDIASSIGPSA